MSDQRPQWWEYIYIVPLSIVSIIFGVVFYCIGWIYERITGKRFK